MLGLSRHEPHTQTAFLPVGGTALLFTDGLVEDREVIIDDNLEKLRAAALQAAEADVEAFANHMMALFGSREDDVAMIVAAPDRLGPLDRFRHAGEYRHDVIGPGQLQHAAHRAAR